MPFSRATVSATDNSSVRGNTLVSTFSVLSIICSMLLVTVCGDVVFRQAFSSVPASVRLRVLLRGSQQLVGQHQLRSLDVIARKLCDVVIQLQQDIPVFQTTQQSAKPSPPVDGVAQLDFAS